MFKCLNVKMTEKGVSLYLALMIMFILLAIGLEVSLIIISQMKMIKGMEDSVIAFHAADTGIEKILYQDKICHQASPCNSPCRDDLEGDGFCNGLTSPYNPSPETLLNGSSYEIIHTHTTEGPPEYCGDPNYCADFNGDGVVSDPTCPENSCAVCPNTPEGLRHDRCLFSDYWLQTVPPAPSMYDLSCNKKIDGVDLMKIAQQMGKICKFLSYTFKSVGSYKETKRAIEVSIY